MATVILPKAHWWSLSPRGQNSFVSAESWRSCLAALCSPCHLLLHPFWWLRSMQRLPGWLTKAWRGSRHEWLSQVLQSGLQKKAWVDYMLWFMWLHFPAALHAGSCILCNHGDEALLALGRGLQGVPNGSNYQWCHTGSLLAQWCDKTKASANPQHYAFGVVCTDACHHIFWYILKRIGIVKKKKN